MSPFFSLLLLLGTCSAFLDVDKVDDGVDKVDDVVDKVDDGVDKVDDGVDKVDDVVDKVGDGVDKGDDGVNKVDDGVDKVDDGIDKGEDGVDKVDDDVDSWPSLTSVFPPLRRSSFPRRPTALFFHNSAWDLPTRPVLQPPPSFLWNRPNPDAHSAFFGFSDSPFKNFGLPHPFSPFHNVRPAFTPNLLSRNKPDLDFFNHEVDLDHVSDIISPLLSFFNNYLDSSIDFVLSIDGASPEDDDSASGTEKLDPKMEEDTSQQNVNLDDILYEIFEGDDIEMMETNVDKDFDAKHLNLTKDMEEEVIDTAVSDNARLPHTHFNHILEEIFENDNEMLDLNVEKDEVINRAVIEHNSVPHIIVDDVLYEILENDDNEMLYPIIEKHADFESSNPGKEVKGDYEDEVIDPQPQIDFGNEMENARQSQDESSSSHEFEPSHKFSPTIILFR